MSDTSTVGATELATLQAGAICRVTDVNESDHNYDEGEYVFVISGGDDSWECWNAHRVSQYLTSDELEPVWMFTRGWPLTLHTDRHSGASEGDTGVVLEFPWSGSCSYDIHIDRYDGTDPYVCPVSIDVEATLEMKPPAPPEPTDPDLDGVTDPEVLRAEVERLKRERRKWVRTTAREFHMQADRSSLCSDYDKAVRKVNQKVPTEWQIPARGSLDTTYKVTTRYDVTVSVEGPTWTGTAKLETNARDQAARWAQEQGQRDKVKDLFSDYKITGGPYATSMEIVVVDDEEG